MHFSVVSFPVCWGGVFVCIVLTGCENFLSGGRIKEQIEEQIDYANAPSYEIRMECDDGYGSFVTPTILSKKVTDSFDVEFKIASGVKFVGWKSYSKSADGTLTELSSEYISFTSHNAETSEGIYKTTAKFQKLAEGIVIKPTCFAYPAVVEYFPNKKDTENFANTPIEITFNMPMESAESPFDFENVSLTVNGTSLASYFNKEFNSEKTVLTLTPKTNDLINYITTKEVAFIEVKVALSDSISVTRGKTILPFMQTKDSTFTVKYKGEKDETPPKKLEFFVTRHPITLETANTIADKDKFLLETYSDYTQETYQKDLKNKNNGTFYIYGKYFTNGKSIKSVCLTDGYSDTTIYTSKNAEFSTDENGNTIFCLKYINTKNIQYNLRRDMECFVTDNLENVSDSIKFTYYQKPLRFDLGLLLYNLSPEDSFSSDFYETSRKIIKISYDTAALGYNNFIKQNTDSLLIYDTSYEQYRTGFDKDFYTDYFDSYIFECEYTDDSGVVRHGTFTNNKEKMIFQYEIENVQKLNGLNFKISVTDELQNRAETEITFPVPSAIASIDSVSGSTNKKITFASDIDKKYGMNIDTFLVDKDAMTSAGATMQEGKVYKVVPEYFLQTNYNNATYTYNIYKLVGDLSEEVYTTSSSMQAVPDVELDGTPTYKISDADSSYMDITVKIKQDSWTKFDKIYVVDSSTKYSFQKNEYSLLLPKFRRCSTMCSYATNLTIYGIKNGVRSNGTLCTIPKLTGSENDYKAPVIKVLRKNFDYFTVTLSDEEGGSGADYANVLNIKKIDGTYKYILNGANNFTVDVPVWDLEELSDSSFEDYNYIYIDVEGYDNKGNKGTNSSDDIIHMEPFIRKYKITKSSNTWTFSSLETNGYADNLEYYTLTSSESNWQWSETANRGSRTGSTNLNNYAITFPSSSVFVKIIRSDPVTGTSPTGYKTQYDYSPLYYYTGTWNTGDYDLIIPNGSSKTSVGISSDAPVFVQTLVTSRPYSECSQWSPEKWEFNRKHFGEKLLSFSTSDKNAKRYAIPMDKISSGECYCVIAHFADGTSTISEVMQK